MLDTPTSTLAYSPYYNHEWKFGVTEYAVINPYRDGSIHRGLHAFVYKKDADYRGKGLGPRTYSFPAIIPAGTKFYIGHKNRVDIVAEKMTVYKSLKDALQGRELGLGNLSLHLSDLTAYR
jgi:hypothetical protein